MDDYEESILVAGSLSEHLQPARRERGRGTSESDLELSPVRVSELRKNVDRFFSQLSEVLAMKSGDIGAFKVDQVEVSAQITGEGKVCLLGSGTKIGVSGGFKFILKRAD